MINEVNDKKQISNNYSAKTPYMGRYVLVVTDHFIDWHKGGGGIYTYMTSVYQSSSMEYVYVEDDYSGGGSGYETPNYHSHFDAPHGPALGLNNHPEEVIIDTSFVNIDKIYCTYNQLSKTTTIKELLQDFLGSDADYDLTLQVVENLNCNNSNDVNGCTSANYDPLDNKVTISIDKDYINNSQTPTLFLAKTILHESIHASLFLAVKKLNGGVSPASTSFGTLYEEYRQLKGWQHEFMADKYIDIIAQGLKDIHALLGDQTFIDYYNANTLWDWDKFYKEVAWTGLYDTTKGQEHTLESDYNTNVSLYISAAETNSTKLPKCD